MPQGVHFDMLVPEERMDARLLSRACKQYLSLNYGGVGETSRADKE